MLRYRKYKIKSFLSRKAVLLILTLKSLNREVEDQDMIISTYSLMDKNLWGIYRSNINTLTSQKGLKKQDCEWSCTVIHFCSMKLTDGLNFFFSPKWCIYMPGYFLFHSLSHIPSSTLKRTLSFRKSGLSVVPCDCAVSLFISHTDALQGLWLAWDHKWVCGAKKTLPCNSTESKKRNKNPERRHSWQ